MNTKYSFLRLWIVVLFYVFMITCKTETIDMSNNIDTCIYDEPLISLNLNYGLTSDGVYYLNKKLISEVGGTFCKLKAEKLNWTPLDMEENELYYFYKTTNTPIKTSDYYFCFMVTPKPVDLYIPHANINIESELINIEDVIPNDTSDPREGFNFMVHPNGSWIQINSGNGTSLIVALFRNKLTIVGAFVCVLSFIIIIVLKKKKWRRNKYADSIKDKKKQDFNSQALCENDITKDIECIKYNSSALTEEQKTLLLESLNNLMEKEKIYTEKGLTIKTLAVKLNTNRTYLSQLLNDKYQMNFNCYLNKYRIEEAKRILSEPDNTIPIKNVHEYLGFNSNSTFYEVFKKQSGVSPSVFQKTSKGLQ